jgi:dTDP-glucose pyrophosphorylase
MSQNKNISLITTDKNSSILQCLKKMDEIRHKLLLVLEGKRFIGLISIGDIQRAIINNIDINSKIGEILRNDYIFANLNNSIEEIKSKMLSIRSEFMPVVDNNGHLVTVHFWEDLFGKQKPKTSSQFNLPVIIMAGGIGSRLKPLTNVLPKPLIPIGERTMLEEIFDRFSQHGSNTFHISINYKADLIRSYIQNQNLPYSINYFEEEKPLGTAGSLCLLKGKITQSFFVTNCDILIEQDYSEILDYHINNKNEITLIAALKHIPLSYGIIETGKNGHLKTMVEKPELTLKINSGMYILEPHLIDEIPKNKFFHITDLISSLMVQNRKVGVFPVSQNSWVDVGDWVEYMKVLGIKV